jgi:hypothetical protein
MYKNHYHLLFFISFFITHICGAQQKLDFESQEYYFVAYYDDISSPPFVFSFLNNAFYLDIPELDTEKLENLELIKGRIQGNYRIETKNGFTYLNVGINKYLVLNYGNLLCVLIDCSNSDAFFFFF